ncbi:TonB-dependent receptor [Mangrovivirga sp. M17]|uniref:TonB-dependent receptor n=1 Tax=Mangrovivirga halotolerans TaxID=2993936 RepID=A0ABT3RX27_9BACT|nr:carboxypeptidase-like regulatory domain-containing protein [Mangrovivirga halotolerans]MCX2745762.1 TonB-dependent receptor [Mangrovivirga halotolerans]
MLRIFILILGMLVTTQVSAQEKATVTGKVLDADNKEPLIGVSVIVKNSTKGVITDLNGEFKISGLPTSKTVFTLSYIGFETKEVTLNLKEGNNSLGTIELISDVTSLDEVQVFADVVVDRKTPVAASTIKAITIDEQLGAMALPELLNSTPGVYATKGSGAYGDARVNIRGFEQTEILFMINGVPLNDMENGRLYWSNFAGLSEITSNMQVQRGLGASKLGLNSVGGTINIVTKPSEEEAGGQFDVRLNSGTWDNRYSLTLNSGQLEGGWAFTFQGARTTGDGYKKGAYTDAWSYFFNAQKTINNNHTLMFTIFGAPAEYGRAWNTNTAEYELRDNYWFNPAVGYYKGGLYNSSQGYSHKPQATLNWYWDINTKMSLSTSAYVSIARAYGTSIGRASNAPSVPEDNDGYINFELIDELNTANEQTVNNVYGTSNSISGASSLFYLQGRHNNHNWIGAISNLNWDVSDAGDLVLGVDVRTYKALHYASVEDLLGGEFFLDSNNGTDNNILNPNNAARLGDKVYYNYDGHVKWGALFGQYEHDFGKLNAFVSVNLSRSQMYRYGNFWNGSSYNINNSFGKSDVRVFNNYNAKAGLNYNIDGKQNIFVNGGYITRAPFLRNSFIDARFSNDYLKGLTNEKITAAELGYSYRTSRLSANINAYWIRWNDKAFSSFVTDPETFDRTFFAVTGQSQEHKGIEMDARFQLLPGLEATGMVSLGDFTYLNDVNTVLTDEEGNSDEVNMLIGGLPVGNSAQTTGFIGLHYKGIKDFYIGTRINYFADLYEEYDPTVAIGNENVEVRKLDNYKIVDVYAGYYFEINGLKARVNGNVNNLFDELYIRRSDQRYNGEDYGFGITYNAGLNIYF